ncbi:YggS family pyridoxal phosphate-dependent enzyme [Cytobacillus gottheilii]|uniref:YggS family pyridoxal phosphate-dependent enzyme n=1 Tax=Cytobacillus gottheilii TaxID=859144 RepID=UPI0009BB3495|nr:YggS family pyridoxal phosphate-dependent enzyme [Cytobacillus gottheilii]
MKVEDNLKEIQQKIDAACQRSGRNQDEVKIIAVTKYVSIERAQEAFDAGIKDLGENRDDGLLAKWEVLEDKPTWHFIGSLQSKKVKNIIDKAAYIHSLDRLSLAAEIQKRAIDPVNCLVQVNVSGEESKHGLPIEEVKSFISSLKPYTNIRVAGLMTMAPLTDDENLLRSCFRKLKGLQQDIQAMEEPFAPCTELSMGMSNDYTIAIEEGATMIRIGTALVGQ